MTAASPQQLVEHALATSTSDQCVVLVHDSTSANLRWANNTLTTNGVMHDVSVTVVAFHHGAQGTASGSVSASAASTDQVTRIVEAADAQAKASTPAEDANPLVEGDAAEDWFDPSGETSIEVYADFAPALGEAFGRADSAGRILYGFVDHDVTTTYLGSSTGLRLRHVQPTGHYGCTAKPTDLSTSAWVGGATRDFSDVDVAVMDTELERRLGWASRQVKLDAGRYDTILPPTDLSTSAWVGGATRDFSDVDVAVMDTELERRLGWASRQVRLDAGRYDTILPPTAVSDLMIYAYWTASARDADDGQTVFSKRGGGTRIGEVLSDKPVQMYSDPGYDRLEAQPFTTASSSNSIESVFDNGLPLSRTDWVKDGRLAALLQNRFSAGLTGQPVTPYVDNLVVSVDGASGSTQDLVAGVDRGLLLTCLWYIREVDPQTLLLTGLTRDGVYLVEGGEVTAAVNNFRFNESPIDLMRRFTHASETGPSFSREWGDYFPRTATPALRVPDFNMSTVSQAN